MKITESQIRVLIRESIKRQTVLEREDIDPGGYELSAAKVKKDQEEAEAKAAQIAAFKRGDLPAGVKLSTEEGGEPKIVFLGKFTYNGSKIPYAIVYSRARRTFDPVNEGYGRMLSVGEILNGSFEPLPTEYMLVSKILYGVGNESMGVNLPARVKSDSRSTTFTIDNTPKNIKIDRKKPLPTAPPDASSPIMNLVRAGIEKGSSAEFYKQFKIFVPYTQKFKKVAFKATAAGIEASQKFKCVISGKEMMLLIGKAANDTISDEEVERIIPCFAETSDSFAYMVGSAIISGIVGFLGTPAAGMATYAVSQVIPTLPVLIYHVNKGNTAPAVYYAIKIAADLIGFKVPFKSIANLAAIIINAVAGALHKLEVSSPGITTSSIQSAVSSIFGSDINNKSGETSLSSVIQNAIFSDPQGLNKLYPLL